MTDVDGLDRTLITCGINELKQAVSKCAHDHGWWENGDRNMGEMIALMHSELSEALESYRNDEPKLFYQYPTDPKQKSTKHEKHESDVYIGDCQDKMVLGKPCGIATEFADVIIRILDTCHTLDIPVTEALIRKHEYNLTRPYRHGGKKA